LYSIQKSDLKLEEKNLAEIWREKNLEKNWQKNLTHSCFFPPASLTALVHPVTIGHHPIYVQ